MLNRAASTKRSKVGAEYISIARNGIVVDLYDCLGLRRMQQDGESMRYVLECVAPVKFPSWITLKGQIYGF